MRSYIYQPIAKDSDEIRLVKFIDIDVIKIIHVDLKDPPKYRALSYAWGTGLRLDRIKVSTIVDGKRTRQSMAVGATCMLALTRLFQDNSDIPVWIDAICIDQANNNERNHQVQRMSRIYSSAWKVQIYLGHIENHIEVGFDYIRREYEYILKDGSPLKHTSYKYHARSNERTALDWILKRPWFRRRWVLQEVHFAKQAEVLCQATVIPWEHLRLLGYFQYFDGNPVNDSDQYAIVDSKLYESAQERLRFNGDDPLSLRLRLITLPPILEIQECGRIDKPLYDWIQATLALECSEETDIVYSLLGLASDVRCGKLVLDVDYSCTMREVKEKLLAIWGEDLIKELCQKHQISLSFPKSTAPTYAIQSVIEVACESNRIFADISAMEWWLISDLLKDLASTSHQLRNAIFKVFPFWFNLPEP